MVINYIIEKQISLEEKVAYLTFLALHNVIRWLVFVFSIFSLILAYQGWIRNRVWSRVDRIATLAFTSLLDVQILFGLLLYFAYSPITRSALRNLSVVWINPDVRFFAIEHGGLMLVAAICAHIGSVLSKKAETAGRKHRIVAIWFTISSVLIIFGIPWTRPLLPNIF